MAHLMLLILTLPVLFNEKVVLLQHIPFYNCIKVPMLFKIWLTIFIFVYCCTNCNKNWAPSSEFVSSSIPSWQISTAHAQPLRGARDLAFCLKVPLDSLLIWASREGSGETAQMRRLAWTFAARIGYKYQIRLTRSNYLFWNSLVTMWEIGIQSFYGDKN